MQLSHIRLFGLALLVFVGTAFLAHISVSSAHADSSDQELAQQDFYQKCVTTSTVVSLVPTSGMTYLTINNYQPYAPKLVTIEDDGKTQETFIKDKKYPDQWSSEKNPTTRLLKILNKKLNFIFAVSQTQGFYSFPFNCTPSALQTSLLPSDENDTLLEAYVPQQGETDAVYQEPEPLYIFE